MAQLVQRWIEVTPFQFTLVEMDGLNNVGDLPSCQPPFRAGSIFEVPGCQLVVLDSTRGGRSGDQATVREQSWVSVTGDSLNELPRMERGPMNDALAAAPRRYALSFTTGALLAREAVLLAPVYLEQRDWEQVRDLAVKDNLLQARTHRTGVRLASETVQRLSVLTDDEVDLLIEATASERASPHVGCRLPTLRVHRRVRRGGLAGAVPSPRLDAGVPGLR